MKTTVKICSDLAVIVKPHGTDGCISLGIKSVEYSGEIIMQLDKAGALIFGLEQAAEAAQIAQDRAKLQDVPF